MDIFPVLLQTVSKHFPLESPKRLTWNPRTIECAGSDKANYIITIRDEYNGMRRQPACA